MAWVSGGAAAARGQQSDDKEKKSGFTIWRLFRWLFILALVVVLVQMFRRPTPPPAAAARTAEQRAADASSFRNKLEGLQRAHNDGMPGVPAKFTEEELNGYIQQSVTELGNRATNSSGVPTNAEAQAAVASVTTAAPAVSMSGDELSVQMTVERFGHPFVFSLTGRLGTEHEATDEGYVTFHPTSCKLGLVSVPLAMVDGLVQKKLAEPENHEKMKLPDFIQSVRVENGELVIVEK
jgi:hypothetical protein